MISRHLIITGRVQGVGYRAWFAAMAQQKNLSGWVRNRADGSVEALIHGADTAIEAAITAAHKGPPHARVDNVQSAETVYGGPALFEIRR